MDAFTRRRHALASAWSLTDEIVLIGAGPAQQVPGTDLLHEFRAHPEHRYLADSGRPGDVLAFDPRGGWTPFVSLPSPQEQIWFGGTDRTGTPLTELEAWLRARQSAPVAMLGCAIDGLQPDAELSTRLSRAMTQARRTKDGEEQGRMRAAAEATRKGFLAVMKEARPGLTERQLQIKLEAAFFRAGAPRPAFDSIVAGGPRGAVLHSEPTDRVLQAGELLLLDAGAEIGGYASDCTRTFVVGKRPTPEQTDLHALVLAVQENAVGKCLPGKEYKQIHLEASLELAQGLIDFGLLAGDAQSLVERDVQALFFPHGLGHLVGLAVHDAGGYLDERTRSDRPALKYLRTDLPLEPGYALTIEPGLYFIEALLQAAEIRDRYRDVVDWIRVDALRDFGGIRIEDTLIVTEGEPEVLTRAIPKGLVV